MSKRHCRGWLPSSRTTRKRRPPDDKHARNEDDVAIVAYSPLLEGSYVRDDKPLSRPYDHPGTPRRMEALHGVAKSHNATVNQIVLAWMMTQPAPDLELSADDLRLLDDAG